MIINKTSLASFRKDFANAVKTLEEQHGIVINLGNIRYTDKNFSAKITVDNFEDKSPSVSSENTSEFDTLENKMLSVSFGFSENIIGKTFKRAGVEYTVVGLIPRRHKNPVAVTSNGRRYKTGLDFIRPYFS